MGEGAEDPVFNGALNAALARVVAGTRREADAGLAPVGWREAEITRAIRRHPAAENDLFHANLLVLPAIDSPAWNTGFVFRGHVRELLERVAAGQDTRPGTAAECCIAMAMVSMAVPLHGASAGFYLRMASYAFPDDLPFDPSLADHYEKAHRPGMDRFERYVRRRLRVPGRHLDAFRIECDGEHYGRRAACKYAPPGQGGETAHGI